MGLFNSRIYRENLKRSLLAQADSLIISTDNSVPQTAEDNQDGEKETQSGIMHRFKF